MPGGLDPAAAAIARRGAREEARVLRHPAIDVDHLLLALARARVLPVELDHADLQRRVIELRGLGDAPSPEWMPLTGAADAILHAPRAPTRPADLLLAILAADRRAAELLRRHGVDEAAVRAALPVEDAD